MTDVYTLGAPTEWAGPPEVWASTTLDQVAACPRRWQLLCSRWGTMERFPVREHPAAVEGQIVHEALDRLTRACGRHGLPMLGSPAFRAAAAEANIRDVVAQAVASANARHAAHPRHGPTFLIRTSLSELVNRAVRLFRAQYKPRSDGSGPAVLRTAQHVQVTSDNASALLAASGMLSEVRLVDPDGAFKGTIDLVVAGADGVVIVDHKTGDPKEAHQTQVRRYAALWWRCTGERPVRVVLQYLNERWESALSEGDLTEASSELEAAIDACERELAARPGRARVSEECMRCPTRARCDEGWAFAQARTSSGQMVDVEVALMSVPSSTGFAGRVGKRDVQVVYDAIVGGAVSGAGPGDSLRLVAAKAHDGGQTFELKPWTEVYHV